MHLNVSISSTELGKENKDIELQRRIITLDIPFFKDGVSMINVLNFVLNLHTNINREISISLRKDLLCLIDGVYSVEEIEEKIKRLYPNLNKIEVEEEVRFVLTKLRENGFIDSFGNPNVNQPKTLIDKKVKLKYPKRKEDIILFWNGKDGRYIYFPPNKDVIKIKACFYKNIPPEVFEFLILAKGILSLEEISDKLYLLFDKYGFKSREESRKTTKRIYLTCKRYGLVQ